MAVTISIFALPPVAGAADPILHAPNNIGNYGTNDVDVIIPGAQSSVQNVLPLIPPQPIVSFSNSPIPWNKNPLDRNDLPAPPVIPPDATFTNRNKLLNMLKIFMFPPASYYHNDVTFQVSRVGNVVYYLDGPLGELPGPMPLPGGPGGYGIPFEGLIAHDVTANLEKYFVFQSYSLLGVTELLVRTEVDCENAVPEITEIKSKKNNNYHPVWNDADYFKTVWAQMLFGCTQSLVFGLHVPAAPLHGVQRARFTTITTRTFAQVTALANMVNDVDYMPPMTSLAELIEWIRSMIADGETKTFSYSKAAQTITMA